MGTIVVFVSVRLVLVDADY